MKPDRLHSVLSVVAAVIVACLPLHLGAATIEEVVVTAQKREQSLQDVSAAVTAVGVERLENAGIDTIEDLQMIVPSIHLGNDFNMAKLFIRGVGANTSTTGSETGVAMHVDGAFVARAEAQLASLFDLERVEVLRGPQGSLYGRNAVGGSINLITAKPTEEFEGYGRAHIGNYTAYGFEGALSGPILSDRVRGRIAFKTEDRDGFGENPVTGSDVSDLDRKMARVHLEFLPTENIDFLLTGEYYDQDDRSRTLKFHREAFPGVDRLFAIGIAGGAGGTPGFATDPRDTASESDPFTRDETWSITGTANWRLTDAITLTSITNYRKLTAIISQDLDLSAVENGLLTTGQNASVFRRDIRSHQWSEEFQVKYDSDRFNGVAGLYYFEERQRPVDTVGGDNPFTGQPHTLTTIANPSDPTAGGLVPGPPGYPFGPFGSGLQVDGVFVDDSPGSASLAFFQEMCNFRSHLDNVDNTTAPKRVCLKSDLGTDVWAVFGQGNAHFGRITIKFGGRYSIERRTVKNPSAIIARNGLGPIIITTSDATSVSKIFKDFTPELGFEFRATDDLLAYYTYSEGFKAGAGENAAGSTIIVNPENIRNNEFGLKGTFFDNRLVLNVAAYFYDLEGQQINKTQSGGPAGFTTIFENAGQTSAHGVEFEFFATPSDRFRLNGGFSYLDSNYDEFLTADPLDPSNISVPPDLPDDPATDFDPTNPEIQLAGNPTRNSPDWTASLHAEYDFASPGWPGGGVFTLMGDVMYKDDVFFTEFGRLVEGEEAYALLDMNLLWTSGDGHWTGNLWVKNVTDNLVRSSTFQLATGRVLGATYLPPRTYGFTLGYSF